MITVRELAAQLAALDRAGHGDLVVWSIAGPVSEVVPQTHRVVLRWNPELEGEPAIRAPRP